MEKMENKNEKKNSEKKNSLGRQNRSVHFKTFPNPEMGSLPYSLLGPVRYLCVATTGYALGRYRATYAPNRIYRYKTLFGCIVEMTYDM